MKKKKNDIPEQYKAPALSKVKLRQKAGGAVVSIFRLVFLISVSYIILYPLFAMVAYSVQSGTDILDSSVIWISKAPTFSNFKNAWQALDYPTSFLQTLLVGGVSAFIEIFTCAITAYGFARFKFKGKNFLFGLVLLTAIVPVQILVIPLFLNYRYFDFAGILTLISKIVPMEQPFVDLTDTGFTFWLPSLFSVGLRSGLFIFIYRQFFMGLPKELEEASWIDGAGPLKTFFRIVVPSSGTVFLTVTIFSVIWHWNEYYESVIFFNTAQPLAVKLANVAVELQNMRVALNFQAPCVCAACLLFILPMLIMFLLLQKKFIQSIDRVGIVG